MTSKSTSEGLVMVDKEDLARLEEKVDTLTNAVGKLILFEDRQVRMGERLGQMEKDIVANYNEQRTKMEEEMKNLQRQLTTQQLQISKWTNMMIGGWGVFMFLFMVVQWLIPIFISKHP